MLKNPHLRLFRGKKNFVSKNIFQYSYARAQQFSKIFRTTKCENLTRPGDFRTPHGRPTTRFKILRRGLKIWGCAPKFSSRAIERDMLPKLGVLFLRTTSENQV